MTCKPVRFEAASTTGEFKTFTEIRPVFGLIAHHDLKPALAQPHFHRISILAQPHFHTISISVAGERPHIMQSKKF